MQYITTPPYSILCDSPWTINEQLAKVARWKLSAVWACIREAHDFLVRMHPFLDDS
jgi:hypothetical protein